MPEPIVRTLLALSLTLLGGAVQAQSEANPGALLLRGQILYDTHCIACHTQQVHWREQKLASDWASLKALVRRWQASVGLAWSEADIVDVARYLNETFYRYPQSSDVVGWRRDSPR